MGEAEPTPEIREIELIVLVLHSGYVSSHILGDVILSHGFVAKGLNHAHRRFGMIPSPRIERVECFYPMDDEDEYELKTNMPSSL